MSDRRLSRLPLAATNRPIDVIKHWRKSGYLLLDAPYQRGVVWGKKRQRNLIRSLCLGVPIPAIIVNDRFNARWKGEDGHAIAVIDGKQRCTAILRFLDNELDVPGEWFGLEGPVLLRDLPEAEQRGFRMTITMPFAEGTLSTIGQEQEVFDLINFGGLQQGESDDDLFDLVTQPPLAPPIRLT